MFDSPFVKNSDFNAFDLAGSLAVNYVSTGMACKDSGMRIGVGIKDKSGAVPVWGDARLLGGIGAALAAHFMGDGNDMIRRGGHDVATGLLNSFVATESCRRAAQTQAKVSGDYTAMLGFDDEMDDDDLFDADVLGAEYEEADLNFAYGW